MPERKTSYLSTYAVETGDCRDEMAWSRQLPGPSRRAGRRRVLGCDRPWVSAAPVRFAIQPEQSTGQQARQSAPGANLLGNPLKVVLWLVDEMKRRGTPLQAGDRLSLGAPGKLFPLKEAGKTYSYALNGLPGGTTTVSVTIK
jgi:2-keto-4-pentenoate hydratase